MVHNLAAVPVFLGLPAAAFTCSWQSVRTGHRRFGLYCAATATTMLATMALAGAGLNQSPRLVNLAGLFQRASIVTGFGWLTALSAQALTGRLPPQAANRQPEPAAPGIPPRTVSGAGHVSGRTPAGQPRDARPWPGRSAPAAGSRGRWSASGSRGVPPELPAPEQGGVSAPGILAPQPDQTAACPVALGARYAGYRALALGVVNRGGAGASCRGPLEAAAKSSVLRPQCVITWRGPGCSWCCVQTLFCSRRAVARAL